MKGYSIILSHGPVESVRNVSENTAVFTLGDGSSFTITFSISEDKGTKLYHRIIVDHEGNRYSDSSDFDIFDEGLTEEDYAQWTADNFEEIFELIEEETQSR